MSPNSASTSDCGCVIFLNVCIEELCVALWARGCWWVVDSCTCWPLLYFVDCVMFPSRSIGELCVLLVDSSLGLRLWIVTITRCEFVLLIYPGLGVVAELFWPR